MHASYYILLGLAIVFTVTFVAVLAARQRGNGEPPKGRDGSGGSTNGSRRHRHHYNSGFSEGHHNSGFSEGHHNSGFSGGHHHNSGFSGGHHTDGGGFHGGGGGHH